MIAEKPTRLINGKLRKTAVSEVSISSEVHVVVDSVLDDDLVEVLVDALDRLKIIVEKLNKLLNGKLNDCFNRKTKCSCHIFYFLQ